MKKVIIGVVIVVALVVLYFGFSANQGVAPATYPSANNTNQNSAPSVTAAESTPDAIASSLLAPDPSAVTPVESDPSLTASNDQAVNTFDQSFDTTQF